MRFEKEKEYETEILKLTQQRDRAIETERARLQQQVVVRQRRRACMICSNILIIVDIFIPTYVPHTYPNQPRRVSYLS